jgi:hypothetical protein
LISPSFDFLDGSYFASAASTVHHFRLGLRYRKISFCRSAHDSKPRGKRYHAANCQVGLWRNLKTQPGVCLLNAYTSWTRVGTPADAFHSLARPAPLCKDRALRIGRAAKQACEFERFVTFRAWGQQASLLQRICRADFAIDSVGSVLCFFAHDSANCDHQVHARAERSASYGLQPGTALFPAPDAFLT